MRGVTLLKCINTENTPLEKSEDVWFPPFGQLLPCSQSRYGCGDRRVCGFWSEISLIFCPFGCFLTQIREKDGKEQLF